MVTPTVTSEFPSADSFSERQRARSYDSLMQGGFRGGVKPSAVQETSTLSFFSKFPDIARATQDCTELS